MMCKGVLTMVSIKVLVNIVYLLVQTVFVSIIFFFLSLHSVTAVTQYIVLCKLRARVHKTFCTICYLTSLYIVVFNILSYICV